MNFTTNYRAGFAIAENELRHLWGVKPTGIDQQDAIIRDNIISDADGATEDFIDEYDNIPIEENVEMFLEHVRSRHRQIVEYFETHPCDFLLGLHGMYWAD